MTNQHPDGPQKDTPLEKAKKILRRIQNYEINEEWLTNADSGAPFFESTYRMMHEICKYFRRIPESLLDEVPHIEAMDVFNNASRILIMFDEVQKLASSSDEDVSVEIETLYNNMNSVYSTISHELYLTILKGAKLIARATEERSSALISQLSSLNNEVAGALQRGIVTKESLVFRAEANSFEKAAEKWACYSLLMAILTLGIAFVTVFFYSSKTINGDVLLHIAVSKVLIVGVMTTLLFVCVKNYMANKHNATVNRHRENALLTYTKFEEALKGKDEKRDAVLMLAASCIYSPQPTGFSKEGAENNLNINSIIQALMKSRDSS